MLEDNGNGTGPWRVENPREEFVYVERLLDLCGVGAKRPWSIPEQWAEWVRRCVLHGCLDAPESHPVRGERPLLLCAEFPFDQNPPPCESTIFIEWLDDGQTSDSEGFPLTFGELLLWAHIQRWMTVDMEFPYPDLIFGSDGDTQAVTAYARWLEASMKLGWLEQGSKLLPHVDEIPTTFDGRARSLKLVQYQ